MTNGKLTSTALRVSNINIPNTQTEEQTTKIHKQELTLATLNVQTLTTEESEVELAHALEEIKFDIYIGPKQG